jgi:XTP/dITP diphosphohydrolase
MKILIGTNNPGKFADAERVANSFEEIAVFRPTDLGIMGDPDESGQSYVENSRIKRDFYAAELQKRDISDIFVIGDDSGIEIDALNGEPGIHSRRWRDGSTPMTDQEIVAYCLQRMDTTPDAERGAAFVGNIAIGNAAGTLTHDITYSLRGRLLREAASIDDIPGYPFRALFYLPQFGMLLKDVDVMDPRPEGFMSHREIGLRRAFEWLLVEQRQVGATP